MFSRVWIETEAGTRLPAAMLTPLAVDPEVQRTGIGTRLVRLAMDELQSRGERMFFVLGHPKYYPRFGFSREKARSIESPWQQSPGFMAAGEAVSAGRLVLPRAIADAP